MNERPQDIPERVPPYIILNELNEPVRVIEGPFTLAGPQRGELDSDLMFRWLPSPAIEFDGSFAHGPVAPGAEWTLLSEGDRAFSAPVHLTHATLTFGSESSRVRGILQEPITLGDAPFEMLRFSLANFPDYLGSPVQCEPDSGQETVAGRLHLSAAHGECQLDVIPEAAELRKSARQAGGYFISHVGRWLPSDGRMSVQDAEKVGELLFVWFGFLRGAWTGPLFPQGLRAGELVWQQYAAWKLREVRKVPTWLPRFQGLNLAGAFSRFAELWEDPGWHNPLKLAVSWLVEANASEVAPETRIVLAQVALELLAWVHLVEAQQVHSRKDFKALSAAGRIRALLDHISVPAEIPDHLTTLPPLCSGNAFDGPGVITTVRNDLVHATDKSRASVQKLSGRQLYECSQLALQYVELVLLSLCGYSGHYKRRGWQGWEGGDEALVPWSQAV